MRGEDIIQAMARLRTNSLYNKLVIAGQPSPDSRSYQKQMTRLARSLGVGDQIIWTGHLASAEMSWCYTHCGLFVMTSRVEACPNTALEAMSHGCIIIAANNPPLPELFAACAIYYTPGNVGHLARVLLEGLSMSEGTTRDLAQTARRRASSFKWQETADNTIRQFELAIASRTRA